MNNFTLEDSQADFCTVSTKSEITYMNIVKTMWVGFCLMLFLFHFSGLRFIGLLVFPRTFLALFSS